MNAGKSGGFRLWWLEEEHRYVFLCIYTHRDDGRESEIVEDVHNRLSDIGY